MDKEMVALAIFFVGFVVGAFVATIVASPGEKAVEHFESYLWVNESYFGDMLVDYAWRHGNINLSNAENLTIRQIRDIYYDPTFGSYARDFVKGALGGICR